MGISLLLDKAVSETFFSMRNRGNRTREAVSTLGRFGVPHVAMVIILHLQPSCYPPGIKYGWLENTLLIGDFPIETPISSGFPIATFDYRRVIKHGNEQNHSFMKDFPAEASICRGFPS